MVTDIYFNPPKRHWDFKECSFENFKADSDNQKNTLNFLEQFDAKSPMGLYLHGPTGRGKSHLLVATARHLKKSNVQVSYCDGTTLWSNITQCAVAYKQNNPIVTADIVIVDDIDLTYNNQTNSELLYQFILDLYDRGKPTLFSSNHSPERLIKKLVVGKDKKSSSYIHWRRNIN